MRHFTVVDETHVLFEPPKDQLNPPACLAILLNTIHVLGFQDRPPTSRGEHVYSLYVRCTVRYERPTLVSVTYLL